MSEISERVKKIVVEHLGVESDKVVDSASFVDDLGADSLDTVELVMAFEEEFNIEIPDDMAEISLEYNIEVHLPNFLTENKLSKSNSDARRLIEAGSVKIGDKKIDSIDVNSEILINNVLQVGKRKFLRINKK